MKTLVTCGLFIAMILPGQQAMGQQRPKPSLFMINYAFFNPALNGVEDYAQVQGGLRRQWVGTDGAPATNWLSASMPLRGKGNSYPATVPGYERPSVTDNGHGLGISFYQDNIGPYANTNINMGYAYHLPLTGELSISAGFSAGINHYKYDTYENLYIDQANDPSAVSQAMAYTSNTYSPDLNIGVMLYGKNFFAGISVMQLIKSEFVETPNGKNTTKPEFCFSSGYSAALDDNGMRLWMSALVVSDFVSPASVQVSSKMDFRNLFWFGMSYRNGFNLGANAGLNIAKECMLAYAYEWSMDGVYSPYGKGSHEITLAYKFLKPNQNNTAKIGW